MARNEFWAFAYRMLVFFFFLHDIWTNVSLEPLQIQSELGQNFS